jgi:small subunit ribosomal protein S2
MVTDGRYDTLSKKEIARAEKEKRKLLKNLEGIRQMSRLPDAVFVVDTRKEKIAVDEARKLKIPVIGVVDTNCDPDEVDYVVPGNDDAPARSVEQVQDRRRCRGGPGMRESRMVEEDAARAEGRSRRLAASSPAVRPQRRRDNPDNRLRIRTIVILAPPRAGAVHSLGLQLASVP